MYDEIRQMSEVGVDNVLEDSQNVFYVLMGKPLKITSREYPRLGNRRGERSGK